MSNYLRDRCQVGQSLLIEAPLGSFYLREVERPLVLWQVELVYQLSWECLITWLNSLTHLQFSYITA